MFAFSVFCRAATKPLFNAFPCLPCHTYNRFCYLVHCFFIICMIFCFMSSALRCFMLNFTLPSFYKNIFMFHFIPQNYLPLNNLNMVRFICHRHLLILYDLFTDFWTMSNFQCSIITQKETNEIRLPVQQSSSNIATSEMNENEHTFNQQTSESITFLLIYNFSDSNFPRKRV